MSELDAAILNDVGAQTGQDEESEKTVKMVMKEFQRLKAHRAKYDRNWLNYYKIFRGDQWLGVKMPKGRQKEIINLVWQSVQSSMPLQTDVRPKVTYIPEEPSDAEFAKVLDKCYDADADRWNWLMQLCEIIIDGYLYGVGYGYTGYNEDADFGIGAATFKSEDPFYCYPDSEATDINSEDEDGLTDSRIFIIAKPVLTCRVKAKYKEHAEHIKSDIKDLLQSSKTAINDFQFKTSNSDLDMAEASFFTGRESSPDKTLVITCYLKPDETEEIEEPGENEGETKYITKKKYPRGRKLVIANGVLLEDGELPFAHGRIPFAKYLNYILPREFFGVSEVEQLESPQRVFNKIFNAQLEIMQMMGNPVWIADTSSGVDPHKLINRTGLVVQKTPNSDVRRLDGVQMSPAAMSMLDRSIEWFNNVAGTQDVSRGQTPGSVTAASAIEALQDAARTRIRQKQRNLDMFMREHGIQYQGIILEKYSKPRVFRVTNDDGSTAFFKMSLDQFEDEAGEQQTHATIQPYGKDSAGAVAPSQDVIKMIINGRFDASTNTGSALPFAVADKEQKALSLFDRQIIDAEEVLKIMDYPDRDGILSRMAEKQAAMAEQQQQQGAT